MKIDKSIDTSTLEITSIIVNDIPKHKKNDNSNEPEYSETISTLTVGLRLFFKDKITQALNSSKALYICYEDETLSPVPRLIEKLLSEKGQNIIPQSKAISSHLYNSQNGGNSAGIVVIVYGKVNSQDSCIILKLERDKGARLTRNNVTKTYEIEEIQNLMLTEKTKIFKVVIFINRKDFNANYDGILFDQQISIASKMNEITTWFLSKFLGCLAYNAPRIATKNFYNYTRAFIDTVEDKLTVAKYLSDLNSYLQKNSSTLNPKEYADDYLKSEHKDDYKDFLKKRKFNFSVFQKDLHYVKNKINKMMVKFINGITIINDKGSIHDKIKLSKTNDGQHKAEIISKIKNIT